MTCTCGHIKAEHQFNGKLCYQCSCTQYALDIKEAKDLIQKELQSKLIGRRTK